MPENGKMIAEASTVPGYRPKLQFDPEVEKYFSKVFGPEHFKRICGALTCPSIYTCIRVNTLQTTRGQVFGKLCEILKSNWNNAVSQTLRKSFLDGKNHERVNFEGRPILPNIIPIWGQKDFVGGWCYEHSLLENIILVQGGGPHNIDYSCEHGTMKEVIVSRKCAEAVLRGANVFVPGVLACSAHVEQGDLVSVSTAIEHLDKNGDWVVGLTRGTILCSEHGKSQLDDVERKNWYIGKGKAVLSRTAMFRESHGVAIEMIDRVYQHPPLHGVLKGEIFLQNLPSIVTAAVLEPKAGERILDMCAAPGGKCTAIAMLMQDQGQIIAIDRSHNKVMDIKRLAEEMKLTCIHAYKLDALKAVLSGSFVDSSNTSKSSTEGEHVFVPISSRDSVDTPKFSEPEFRGSDITRLHSTFQTIAIDDIDAMADKTRKPQYRSNAEGRKEARKLRNGTGRSQNLEERVDRVKGFPPHSFDKVLLDPPCSALGLRPRLFAGQETMEALCQHAVYQRRMFDQAVQLCRPGGTLVYSTCTFNPGENEALVRYALDTYNFLSLVDQNPKLGGPGLTGGLDVSDSVSSKWLREEERHLVQRFDPAGPLDTIGFFIAKFHVSPQR